MNLLNNISGNKKDEEPTSGSQPSGGSLFGKLNSTLGGGESGEKNEDGLDKGVDYVQEHVLGSGQQNNESAVEQAKDEQISDGIRGGFKNVTGKDFPIADK